MNKLFILVALNATLALFCVNSATAQWNSGFGIYNTADGKVGIGTSTPQATLDIAPGHQHNLRVGVVGNRANCNVQMAASLAVLAEDALSASINGAVAWDFYNNGTNPSWAGTLLYHMGTGMTGTQYGLPTANQGLLLFQNVTNGVIGTNGASLFISPNNNVSASFLANGNVGIGTTDTKGYRFAVNGDAVFTKVVVKPYGSWPDYVLDSAYKLRPLEKVGEYVKANHHLPEIPSADSVAKNGIDVGGNQAALLKKVEELTLYMIQMNETVKQQQERIRQLEDRLSERSKKNR